MNRILLSLLLILTQSTVLPKTTVLKKSTMIAGGVAASPAFIQGGTCGNASATTCTITLGASVTAHDYVVVYEGSNTTPSAPTMTGETFVNETGCNNTVDLDGNCYVILNAVGGQTAVVCNISGTAAIGCSAAEFTSPSSGHAVDGTGGAGSASTAMSVATSGPNVTANDTCVGMAMGNVTSATWTQGGGWTARVNSSGNFFPFMESESFAVAATETATGTGPSGTTAMTQGIMCLKP